MSFWNWLSKKKSSNNIQSDRIGSQMDAKPSQQATPRLIHTVDRTSSTGFGPFLDLYNDLALLHMTDLDRDPLVKMAYGYARRLTTFCLYFQGHANVEHIKQAQHMFSSLQAKTEQTVAFQEAASNQATELLVAYIPQITFSHLMVISKYASQGMTAGDVAELPGFDFEMPPEKMEPPFRFETCMDIADLVVQAGFRVDPGLLADRPMRLIDLVEKRTNANLGPFANMLEDIKESKQLLVSDPLLSTAAGYAMWLAGAGVFVAGGVKPDLVLDTLKVMKIFTKDAHGNPEITHEGKAQALALSRTYVPEMDQEAAEEIMTSAEEIVNFYVDEDRRLTVSEVVERAKVRAKARLA